MMRLPYETPNVTMVGSVKDLTQANLVGSHADSAHHITVTVGGISVVIPGTGVLPPGVTVHTS